MPSIRTLEWQCAMWTKHMSCRATSWGHVSFPNCHTAKNIVEELRCILQDWKMPTDCLSADTTDNIGAASATEWALTQVVEELEVWHNWFEFIHQVKKSPSVNPPQNKLHRKMVRCWNRYFAEHLEWGRDLNQLLGAVKNEVPFRKIVEKLEKAGYNQSFLQCHNKIKALKTI